MARPPRFDVPGVAQHIVQRGNDRLPCFAADRDYIRYLQDLRDVARENDCAIHAYVLMTNHVHLLATPITVGALGRMMQALGRRYVTYFNRHYHRTGTLWEGRYKSCLVDSEEYVLRCYRYIELNPLRARMVSSPDAYRWSSYFFNALGESNPLVTPHATYMDLSRRNCDRLRFYSSFVSEALIESELQEIRSYLQQGRVLGSKIFQAHIQSLHGRVAAITPRGRPVKST
jgi:putative transposase